MKRFFLLTHVYKTGLLALLMLFLSPLALEAKRIKMYVKPISKTEFKINGKVVDIFKEYEKQQKAYQTLLQEALPPNHIQKTSIERHLYVEQPEWKETYKISKLKGFYTICLNDAKNELGIVFYKLKVKYMYEFALENGKWVSKAIKNEEACMRNEIMKASTDYTIIPTNKDEKKNIKELTDQGHSYNVAQMHVRKIYKEMLVDARLGKTPFGYESFQVIGLDYDNHAVLIATHYVGNHADAYAPSLGLPSVFRSKSDFWSVQ